MSRLHIAVVTGTRAEFGILRPVLGAIQSSNKLSLSLIATGMHVLAEFGNTIEQIEAEGFRPVAVAMYEKGEPPASSLARGTSELAAVYRTLKPDLVMLLGDRLEMLAAATAALAEQIPMAHLHGGESAPGIWDEQIRHAITKMAHLHFCATPLAQRRIIQMGEPKQSVHLVGAPALDLIEKVWQISGPIASKVRKYRTQGKREHEVLLILHPSGGSDDDEYQSTRLVLDALHEVGLSFQTIGPNNDPGHAGILRAYADGGIRVDMSLSQDQFWDRLVYSSALAGNSSAGIIEAASLGIPVVNIGDRQAGRERNPNVIDVPFERAAIRGAIRKSIGHAGFRRGVARRKNLYGNGRASEKIVGVLERVAAGGLDAGKRFVDC